MRLLVHTSDQEAERGERWCSVSLLSPFYLQSSSPDCAKQEGRGQAEPGDGDCPSVWHDLSFEGCVGALQERCYSEYSGLSAFPATARMWTATGSGLEEGAVRICSCQICHSQHTFLCFHGRAFWMRRWRLSKVLLGKEEAKATCANAVPLKCWGPRPKAHILKPREDSTS